MSNTQPFLFPLFAPRHGPYGQYIHCVVRPSTGESSEDPYTFSIPQGDFYIERDHTFTFGPDRERLGSAIRDFSIKLMTAHFGHHEYYEQNRGNLVNYRIRPVDTPGDEANRIVNQRGKMYHMDHTGSSEFYGLKLHSHVKDLCDVIANMPSVPGTFMVGLSVPTTDEINTYYLGISQ